MLGIEDGYFTKLLDDIEAAWKRDKSEIEADALAVGGVVEAARHKPGGNAAAMREALKLALDALISWLNGTIDRTTNRETIKAIRAALSVPPRQCDVGTALEQAQRFHDFCVGNSSGINGMCKPTCPCIDCFDKCQCLAKWAQMLYAAEEGGKQ